MDKKEQLLEEAISFIKDTKAFAATEAPLLVKETLTFNKICYVLGVMACILGHILSIILVFYLVKSGELTFVEGVFLEITLGVPLTLAMSINAVELLRILIAPRVFLIKYFKGV